MVRHVRVCFDDCSMFPLQRYDAGRLRFHWSKLTCSSLDIPLVPKMRYSYKRAELNTVDWSTGILTWTKMRIKKGKPKMASV